MAELIQDAAHGAELTERVLDVVRQDPTRPMFDYPSVSWVDGAPTPMAPDVLASLRFPSGRPLTPSLRAWLAFDTTLFARHHWFTDTGALAPRPLDAIVTAELGQPWGECYAPIALPECFLLPGGSDSRRVLVVTEPDSAGEYPIVAIDVDDMPFVGIMFPGFDVYVAEAAGLLTFDFDTYTAIENNPVYRPRVRHHTHLFAGETYAEYPF
ncbi:hypothetical protein [Actinokineospora inagensis]|uniref:hypothetical protein n=1 Tax=Actinokineospora inagensis TaxID=103730 RepID=UPI00040F613B|nr:hypothetical protein [Actinokineospora inagensis]